MKVLPGSTIVAILEECWAAIQSCHPSVPDVTISLAFVKRTLGVSYGRHVIVTFDAVKMGGDTLVATLVHEAVHQHLRDAHARDWTQHRGTFRRAAADFGLTGDPHPRFGAVDLTPVTTARYRPFIDALDYVLEDAA